MTQTDIACSHIYVTVGIEVPSNIFSHTSPSYQQPAAASPPMPYPPLSVASVNVAASLQGVRDAPFHSFSSTSHATSARTQTVNTPRGGHNLPPSAQTLSHPHLPSISTGAQAQQPSRTTPPVHTQNSNSGSTAPSLPSGEHTVTAASISGQQSPPHSWARIVAGKLDLCVEGGPRHEPVSAGVTLPLEALSSSVCIAEVSGSDGRGSTAALAGRVASARVETLPTEVTYVRLDVQLVTELIPTSSEVVILNAASDASEVSTAFSLSPSLPADLHPEMFPPSSPTTSPAAYTSIPPSYASMAAKTAPPTALARTNTQAPVSTTSPGSRRGVISHPASLGSTGGMQPGKSQHKGTAKGTSATRQPVSTPIPQASTAISGHLTAERAPSSRTRGQGSQPRSAATTNSNPGTKPAGHGPSHTQRRAAQGVVAHNAHAASSLSAATPAITAADNEDAAGPSRTFTSNTPATPASFNNRALVGQPAVSRSPESAHNRMVQGLGHANS